MGGLVAEQVWFIIPSTFTKLEGMLILSPQAFNSGINDMHYNSLIQSTCAMIFLGTPHRGSEVADLVDNMIRKMGLSFFLPPYITELRSDSPVLNQIDRDFQQNIPGIPIVSFYETRGVPLTNMVNRSHRMNKSCCLQNPRWWSRSHQQSWAIQER